MKQLKITAIFLPLLLLFAGCGKTSNDTVAKSNNPPTSVSTANTSNLTNEKVQRALDKALDWTKVGGKATVLGIQETPQQNAAIVDIRFDDFRYNADQAGTPIAKDKKSPLVPSVGSPNFSDEMYKAVTQMVHVASYSGKGVGTLKHYNDGRWVLTEINFDFMRLSPNLEIQ
ncbi:MAG: hypothetical protein ACR2MG_07700 [Pyrinomonadaceae bacterium]